MSTFISLLRGINVSGQNSLRMPALKALYEQLGYTDVAAYLQSGNVVFSHSDPALDHAGLIQRTIKQAFGQEIPVLVFSENRFAEIATLNPLLLRAGVDESFLHVTFLFEHPKIELPSSLPKTGDEVAELTDGQVYIYCPHGYGRTKLNNSYFERKLKTLATTRNWRTVQALHKMTMEKSPS